MKANKLSCRDLMVGDWVYNTHNSQNEQVAEIGSGLVMLAYNDIYEYEEIEPITLTDVILELNGFIRKEEYEKYEWYKGYVEVWVIFGDEQNVIHIEDERNGIPVSYHNTITFVHELQHALRLCGIEKEIKL